MTGPVEEAGKVAGGIVDALKAQPAVLALSLAQIAMLVFLFYALSSAAGFRDQMLKQQYDFAHRVTEMLAKCIVPEKTSLFKESAMIELAQQPKPPPPPPPKPPQPNPDVPPTVVVPPSQR